MDYPLTVFELWKYLIKNEESEVGKQEKKKLSLIDIISELENEELKKRIETYRGYYFLFGRKNLVTQRIERNKISEEKYRIIGRVVRFLRFVPYVRMILVTGRVAMKNADRKSDLDLLVCLEKGRIFTGRTLVTLAIHLLGKRRYGKKITNRICLNYFITTNSLEIEMQDLFASSEYFFALPLFGFEYFKKFQKANIWIAKYHENYMPAETPNLKIISDDYFSKLIRGLGEKIVNLNWLEQNLKAWQTKRIIADPRTKKAGSLIVANDNSLVFLPEPQGPKVFEKFKERMKNFS
jgi:predicted nucleotidyltransferase